MKALIRHLWDNNRSEIVNRSLLNCHVMGLHSIMLLESPGKTIRLYYASGDHQLHTNPFSENASLAFHPHHCDLTLKVIKGVVFNVLVNELKPGSSAITHILKKFKYHSRIKEGEMKFEYLGEAEIQVYASEHLGKKDESYLGSRDIHSIQLLRGESAAWYVFEGEEDPKYESVCYSPKDLNTEPLNPLLYQKPSGEQVLEILTDLKLL